MLVVSSSVMPRVALRMQKLTANASKLVQFSGTSGEDVSCDFGLKGEPRLNLVLASGGLAGLNLCTVSDGKTANLSRAASRRLTGGKRKLLNGSP